MTEMLYGKLHADAERLFCVAYGLNGYPKINHAIAIPFWMMRYGCSLRAMLALLYGKSYHTLLQQWRQLVPLYNKEINLDNISLDNLPPVSNFDGAQSYVFNCYYYQLSARDDNLQTQQFLDTFGFTFLTSPSKIRELQRNVFLLSHVFSKLCVEQREFLASQLANCVHQILSKCHFRYCGKLIYDTDHNRMMVAKNNRPRPRCITKYIQEHLLLRGDKLRFSKLNKVAKNILNKRMPGKHGRLWAFNIHPDNIVVAFDGMCFLKNKNKIVSFFLVCSSGYWPRVVGIVGWENCKSLPIELCQCYSPGWLWTNAREPVHGYDLQSDRDLNQDQLRIRFAYTSAMEFLDPGFCSRVAYLQSAHLASLFSQTPI